MKKILGLIIGMTGALTFAQAEIAFADASETWDPSTTTEFNFDFSSAISQTQITDAAVHFVDYFTVSAEPATEGHTVTVTLLADEEMNRMVIGRFLGTASNDWDINVSGSDMKIKDFVDEYLIVE